MKIAITADVHLTSYNKNPERYHALENILDQLVDEDINALIFAGDLFDASCNNPGEFENLTGKEQYKNLAIHIIPGNHDPSLSAGTFTTQNINYITEPEITKLSGEVSFFFVPYQSEKTLGEVLATFEADLEPAHWILVAHGDYLSSTTLRNEYEEGLYMPLSGREIQRYQPRKVFLGHIHAPFDSDILHYPGSPCGLDITEGGIRSFLIYDTRTGIVNRQSIKTNVIFIQESLTVLPTDNEVQHAINVLKNRISGWGLDQDQMNKVRARMQVQGYSSNREQIRNAINEFMNQEKITLIEPLDFSKLKIANDVMRSDIALAVKEKLETLELPAGPDEPTIDAYLISAMSQIYGD
jgi:DNA repair exonuclease SbcCD nuclease subunit